MASIQEMRQNLLLFGGKLFTPFLIYFHASKFKFRSVHSKSSKDEETDQEVLRGLLLNNDNKIQWKWFIDPGRLIVYSSFWAKVNSNLQPEWLNFIEVWSVKSFLIVVCYLESITGGDTLYFEIYRIFELLG